jgi:hypothetical protein
MSKWIAEFELEDGDTMPEHMDLEYKGARIDFHCKPLEQEPFINKPCVSEKVCEHDKQMVLDKIRAEIMQLDIFYDNDYFSSNKDAMFKCNDILQILDKYKADIIIKHVNREE